MRKFLFILIEYTAENDHPCDTKDTRMITFPSHVMMTGTENDDSDDSTDGDDNDHGDDHFYLHHIKLYGC